MPTSLQRPTQIDIYTDGSWLHAGKHNSGKAGGWGAVVIETYHDGKQEAWAPSGPTPEHVASSMDAEIYAATAGLRAVKDREERRPGESAKKPAIILHTDQTSFGHFVSRYRKNPAREPKTSTETAMAEMAKLLLEMNGTAVYTSHHKASGAGAKTTDDVAMSIPHNLASREAYRTRLDGQDGELHFGPDKIVAHSGEERDSLVARMFPVDLSVLNQRGR